MLGLAGLQLNFNEVAQFINWHDRLTGVVGHIDLSDFLTCLTARVFQIKADCHVIAVFIDRQVLIGKRRIAQAMTKREAHCLLFGIIITVSH